MKFQIFRSICPIVKNHWRSLEKESDCSVFQSFNWMSHWYDVFCQSDSKKKSPLIIIGFDENDVPTFLAPLEIERLGIFTIGRLAGSGVSDYLSPIFRRDILQKKELVDRLLQSFLIQLRDVDAFIFNKIPEYIGEQSNPLVNTFFLKHYLSAWFYQAPIKNDDEGIANLDDIVLANPDSRRQLRRLSKLGDVSFSPALPEEKFDIYWKELRKHKDARYKKTRGLNPFVDPKHEKFYVTLPPFANIQGQTQFSALFVGQQPVALHWGVRFRSTHYYLLPAFDDRWGKFSVGRILMEYLVGLSQMMNASTFDLSVGNESYKKKLATNSINIYRGQKPLTALGYIFFASLWLSF